MLWAEAFFPTLCCDELRKQENGSTLVWPGVKKEKKEWFKCVRQRSRCSEVFTPSFFQHFQHFRHFLSGWVSSDPTLPSKNQPSHLCWYPHTKMITWYPGKWQTVPPKRKFPYTDCVETQYVLHATVRQEKTCLECFTGVLGYTSCSAAPGRIEATSRNVTTPVLLSETLDVGRKKRKDNRLNSIHCIPTEAQTHASKAHSSLLT